MPIQQKKAATRKRRPSLRSVLAQAERAGFHVGSVEVRPDGSIVIVPARGQEPVSDAGNPWDEVLKQ
jgi:hypothetical protein